MNYDNPIDLIYNFEDVKKFFSYISGGKQLAVPQFFVSLSARKKYLTDEERKILSLGNLEMFSRAVLSYNPKKDSDQYLFAKIAEVLYTLKTKLSPSGQQIPNKCSVMYSNINPIDPLVAVKAFIKEYDEKTFEYMIGLSKGRRDTSFEDGYVPTLNRRILSHFQQSSYHKNFIDIDCDFDKSNHILYKIFENFLLYEYKRKNLRFMVIETKSGFHVVVDSSTIEFNYTMNIETTSNIMKKEVGDEFGEVKQNKDNMVPVPGILQGLFETKIREEISNL